MPMRCYTFVAFPFRYTNTINHFILTENIAHRVFFILSLAHVTLSSITSQLSWISVEIQLIGGISMEIQLNGGTIKDEVK